MDQQDPQQRIAELELQLAQQKRIAELERQLADARAAAGDGQPVERPAEVSAVQLAAIDEHARRLAQALAADRSQPFGGPAPLREALARAVVDAGLSQQQYRDVLDRAGLRAGGTIKVGGQVVYQRCDPSDSVFLAPRPRGAYGGQGFAAPQRKISGAGWIGPIVALLGGGIGLCVGIAAAATALIPSSALWMSPVVCRSGYAMAYNTSHYSYKPGQSGTSVSFQCVGDGDSYDVNDFAVFALQSLLAALLVFAVLVVGGLLWRRSRKPA
ncbi:hypothetical protein AWB92_11470 [Mycobacterium sp. IEC1808]|uniref:hypothetical protein n=1 Tax=Mycobacterium sp. IEC1808 TaxID=1743230 RepID=UPI000A1479EA|nr:hypothetical protein [Mycobacterium sp. IEC1808]ORW94368.1 hypothetical protein AWB92_11470 [Mycobacterium sp. IEC1808]